MLALPGSAYLYQGEELGLEQVDVAPEHRQDPAWFRTGEAGRDGCRVPIPWCGDAAAVRLRPGRRASPGCRSPPTGPASPSRRRQATRDSTLAFYRARWRPAARFATTAGDDVELLDRGADVLAFRRGPVTVVLNCGSRPVALPGGRGAWSPAGRSTDGLLPPNTAAWLR